MSTLKQQESPEIWVAAGEGCCTYFEKFSYVLSELPSAGMLFDEKDQVAIKVSAMKKLLHQTVCLWLLNRGMAC